jgi:Ca2+-binding RTX toxin-like protein
MTTAFNGNLDGLLNLSGSETEIYGIAVSSYTTVPTSYKPELTTLYGVTNGSLPTGVTSDGKTNFLITSVDDTANSFNLDFLYAGSVVGSYTAFVIGYCQDALLFSVNSVFNTPDTLATMPSEIGVLSLTPLVSSTAFSFATAGGYGLSRTAQPNNTATLSGAGTITGAISGDYNIEVVSPTVSGQLVTIAPGYQAATIAGSTAATLVNANGGDVLMGGAGETTLLSVTSGDTLEAGTADSVLVSFEGSALETAAGQGGDNLFFGGASPVTVVGGSGHDTVILASGGAVTTGGGGSQIWLSTGATNVTANGADTLVAGGGSETVNAAGASGVLAFGGSGTMRFTGGAGASTVVGLDASVTVAGGAGGGLFLGGTAGNNLITSGGGPATMIGGGGGDVLIATGNGNNLLQASSGAETLSAAGTSGSNAFFGGFGNDSIFGGTGSNAFTAGPGNMTLVGGGTVDLFVFLAGATSKTVIDGFNAAHDYIKLEGFGSGASQAALATLASSAAGATMSLTDGTTITFSGIPVGAITANNFV